MIRTLTLENLPLPKRGGNDDIVRFLFLDLSDQASVKAAARSCLRLETRLDVIWHNAAIMLAPEGSVSTEGHELTFATNVLGPFLLQHFLTPLLLETVERNKSSKGAVRSCSAGSGASVQPPGDDGVLWDSWALPGSEFAGLKGRTARYMQSKACNAILASEMAKRHPALISSAFNPGALRTDIARHAPGILAKLHYFISYPPRLGAMTELYSGFAEDVANNNGCFVVPWGAIGTTVPKVTDGIEKRNSDPRLSNLCEKLVRDYY